ncbi:magnesium/cobalt transporter CorA [Candidatus Woesearchaeota archaeon]|nr:magnesium/cobalt transporter CorA [Candidatus Woesearchaeota archaeon]
MFTILQNHKGKIKEVTVDNIKSLDTDWIDCYKPNDKELSLLVEKTGLPLTRLKSYLNDEARPHVVEMKNFSLIIFAVPFFQNNRVHIKNLNIFLFGSNNILTLHNEKLLPLQTINSLIKKDQPGLLDNPSHFVFNLMTEVVNDYFVILEQLHANVDNLEDEVLNQPKFTQTREIRDFKRNILYVHRGLTANREVIVSIEKEYLSRISKQEIKKYRFIYNDLVQLIDMNETYRDILTTAMELYLTNISNNLNNTVKRLTGWGGLILIPTLIASIYGMNFHDTASKYNMPELQWKFGYFFALGLIIGSIILLYYYFKKKDWL